MNNQSLTFLSILKNAALIRKESVTITYTDLLVKFLILLYKDGLIQSFGATQNKKHLIVVLRYSYNKNFFKNLKHFTQVARNFTLTYRQICKLSTKKFISIFSTDNGLMTGLSCKQQRLGGRLYLIC